MSEFAVGYSYSRNGKLRSSTLVVEAVDEEAARAAAVKLLGELGRSYELGRVRRFGDQAPLPLEGGGGGRPRKRR